MKIALLHYTHPPVIGGVESVLERHAQLFADAGHEVRVICAEGESLRVPMLRIPEMSATHPLTVAAQQEIREGEPGKQFRLLVERLKGQLAERMEGCELVIAHNLLSMPFNLALTEALRQFAAEWRSTRFVSWIHDLAAINPDYQIPDREPWRLLSRRLPHFEQVAVSKMRREQFARLTGSSPAECRVIPNGISALDLLNLTPAVAQFVATHQILSCDAVFLCPARLLKRKNLELALQIVAALKCAAPLPMRCACLITGASDPHNPESTAYSERLRSLVAEWDLSDEVFFVSDFFAVTNPDLLSLYGVSDAVLYPSLQEGFGIPLLEAAVYRLPVFCSDLEPLRALAFSNVTFLDQAAAPAQLAEVVQGVMIANCRKEVLNRFSWETIYAEQIEPLTFKI